VERRLNIPPAPIASVRALERALGVSFATAQVLVRRGLADLDAARAWLAADERHSPSEFAGIDEAVAVVLRHVSAGSRVTVHGDYDVDGVCSTAILVRCLRALGADVDWFLPSRGEDGYGLAAATVERLAARGTRLLVTVDCAITAIDEVALARSLGMDVVVTDHHTPRADGTLPDAPIVHPALSGYPCPDLCAAGVAYKFASALCEAAPSAPRRAAPLAAEPARPLAQPLAAEPLLTEPTRPLATEPLPAEAAHSPDDDLDLVALATVADCVPLRGENRRLVREGLRALAASTKPGLRALMRVARVDPSALDARAIGFRLAPRINAAGRLYRADAGLELVLTADADRAAAIAEELDQANAERRHTETRILFEAEAQVREAGEQAAYVLAADDWHPGVIGIVASRIAERHHRPCVLIALDGEEGTGSGRSIPAFDLLGGLDAAAHLLRHGGHRAAAGCTIARSEVDAFRAAFAAHARATLAPEDLVPVERVDAVVAGDELGLPLAEELERLAPFGVGNPDVSLLVPAARLADARPMGEEGRHVRFTVEAGGHRARAVAFGVGSLPAGELHDVTFALELNEWNGAVEPRLVLRHAQAPTPGVIDLVGEPEDPVAAALAELDAPLPATGATARAAGVPRDRRGGGAAGTIAALVASGEPVLVVCADARRRRGHLEGRLGGFALVAWHALERDPALLSGYSQVIALDPPAASAQAALIDERFTLVWGEPETTFALRAHEAGHDIRPIAATVYRALRDKAATPAVAATAAASPAAAAPPAPDPLADAVAAAPSPAAAGRALRVLAEVGLVRIEGRSAVLLPARRTDLEQSAAFGAYAARLAEGRARLADAPRVQAA
jgi:single-stranded-DNA-specific exonuclease